ncbi:hypothetical protein [Devosia soli]|uniref:hypothetical protein n=1 Tax=Devosia soli TaxID=361041 RepID=UPI000B33C041|nr:hypothetical protein [Devosia soli]
MPKVHDLYGTRQFSALDDGPRRIRMISAVALAGVAWVLFFGALYLYWLAVS